MKFAALILTTLLAGATALSAQTADKRMSLDVYGDWAVRCSDAGLERCVMTQKVSAKGQTKTLVELNIAPSSRAEAGLVLVIAVPEGAEMAVAPQIQGKGLAQPIIFKWRVCVKGFCRAIVDLDNAMMSGLSSETGAAFAHVRYGQQKASVTPLSFKGFGDAIKALKAK